MSGIYRPIDPWGICRETPEIRKVAAYTVDQLCSTPFIEDLVPNADEWDRCETLHDRRELMKRTIHYALGPII